MVILSLSSIRGGCCGVHCFYSRVTPRQRIACTLLSILPTVSALRRRPAGWRGAAVMLCLLHNAPFFSPPTGRTGVTWHSHYVIDEPHIIIAEYRPKAIFLPVYHISKASQ